MATNHKIVSSILTQLSIHYFSAYYLQNMVCIGTKLKITDNTGAMDGVCIGILGRKKKTAKIGDRLVICVKKALPDGSVRSHAISTAILVRTKTDIRRGVNLRLNFMQNAVALVDREGAPRGSRLFGPVPYELKNLGFGKLVSISEDVL